MVTYCMSDRCKSKDTEKRKQNQLQFKTATTTTFFFKIIKTLEDSEETKY